MHRSVEVAHVARPYATAGRVGAFELADTARTSDRGGWLLIAPNGDGLTTFTIKAKRKRLRNGDVCTRAVRRDGIAQP